MTTAQSSDGAGDWVLVGVIAGALGVRGELKVDLETDFPDRFARLKTIFVGAEHRPMAVAGARRHASRVALKLAEIGDRDAAQALQGSPLYIPSGEVMPLPNDTYYRDEIIGLAVSTADGQALGTVQEILATGSNDVYVVHDGTREVLIPALKEIVREVDLAGGRMVIQPVEGLL